MKCHWSTGPKCRGGAWGGAEGPSAGREIYTGSCVSPCFTFLGNQAIRMVAKCPPDKRHSSRTWTNVRNKLFDLEKCLDLKACLCCTSPSACVGETGWIWGGIWLWIQLRLCFQWWFASRQLALGNPALLVVHAAGDLWGSAGISLWVLVS